MGIGPIRGITSLTFILSCEELHNSKKGSQHVKLKEGLCCYCCKKCLSVILWILNPLIFFFNYYYSKG